MLLRHFLTRCEGAGTNNSLRERRHEHVVRLDEEELPTAAFIFMKVTVLEELRVFGVVAVAPLVEHVDAWTLGPLIVQIPLLGVSVLPAFGPKIASTATMHDTNPFLFHLLLSLNLSIHV